MLLLTISFLLVFFKYNYVIIGNIAGFSLLINPVFWLDVLNKKNKTSIRIAPVFLLFLNTLDICYVEFNIEEKTYNYFYLSLFFLLILCVILIPKLKAYASHSNRSNT
jgi:hypothetical protein